MDTFGGVAAPLLKPSYMPLSKVDSKVNSVYHHLPSVGLKHLCLGCTCEAGTFFQSLQLFIICFRYVPLRQRLRKAPHVLCATNRGGPSKRSRRHVNAI